MCDCYTDKCKVCGVDIAMHLADFNTSQDEIEVYCEGCLPAGRKDGILWKHRDSDEARWEKVFVRALTKNAWENASGNHPNSGLVEVVGVPDGTLEVIDEVRMSPDNGRHPSQADKGSGRKPSGSKKCGKLPQAG